MAKARVTFRELLQDSQELGSNDEHMVSRVTFDLDLAGNSFTNLQVTIKQPVGSSFEKAGLEVSAPANYNGPFNYNAFRGHAEEYYRNLVGAAGRGIQIKGGSNIRMRNNQFHTNSVVEFDVDTPG